ncbi:hypothetical protein TRV_06190 [Trichophyton verrucosum HKI 0517]|uniref:RTA1 domain protein n=1 Tax=Trichophyton verrucosum (strain HKI 0517) TaxID=663202 RepID=D4DG88_TRIVH|nr:uncharacterized protein TRV_06190 [Trichophyton verrucosum HKI 0517]EFE39143.1 hypothetical protein TRV_06190 [Trichophyton verrucosum HKI 0517]
MLRSVPFLLLLLSGVEALVPTPVRTAVPQGTVPLAAAETPSPTPMTPARIERREISISIPPVSIPPVSIPSLSLDLPVNTCTPTIAPDKNGWVPPSECNALYLYYPSFGAAIAFSVLFGAVMIVHFVQATIYKAGFVWVILMGATWECIGSPFPPSVLLKLATRLTSFIGVNAFDYMVLARMIHFYIPSRTIGIFKPAILAKIFIVLDFVAFVIQLVGGGMAGPGQTPEAAMRGIHIYMGGIGIQEFFIILFLILAIQFHRQMLHLEHTGRLQDSKRTWRPLLYSLYISLFFITMRIVYRLIEFSSGHTDSNPIPHHEWYMYVFDAVPMLFAIGTWNVIHPGKIIRGPDAKMPSSGIIFFNSLFKLIYDETQTLLLFLLSLLFDG